MKKSTLPWEPSPGDLIQIWDRHAIGNLHMEPIQGHGQLGYVVGTATDHPGPVYKIICFGNNSEVGEFINVHRQWLGRVEKASDVKKIVPTNKIVLDKTGEV